ncbi:MAG: hypothetical protein ACSHWQ_04720 [Spongiibacteraceae bacterium]
MKGHLPRKIKFLLPLLALVLLNGCATTNQKKQNLTGSKCGFRITQAENVKLDLVEQLITEGSYYSALAHLENEQTGSARALWLRAESQRKTGVLDEAYDNYRALSMSCMGAFGHAGMAKILATRGDLPQAHQRMLNARRLSPTNADIRNDYGFILLTMRDYKAAQREFMTALQLQPGHAVAVRNMVMALILDRDARTALRMAKNNGIERPEFDQIVDKARILKRSTRRKS